MFFIVLFIGSFVSIAYIFLYAEEEEKSKEKVPGTNPGLDTWIPKNLPIQVPHPLVDDTVLCTRVLHPKPGLIFDIPPSMMDFPVNDKGGRYAGAFIMRVLISWELIPKTSQT